MTRRLPGPDETLRILATKRSKPARRPSPPAGKALAPLIKALDARFGGGGAGLAARWREIVGADLSRRSEPVRVIRGRGDSPGALEIRVQGPTSALIQHQSAEILQRVNLFLGTGTVDRLRIVQGPVRTAKASTKTPVRRTARPLDAAAEADLQNAMSDKPDGALKDALLRLGRAVARPDSERR